MERKKVVVRATIEYVVDVPGDWGAEQVEFWLNESSRCASNTIREISNQFERAADRGNCPCDSVTHAFVRDDAPANSTPVAVEV